MKNGQNFWMTIAASGLVLSTGVSCAKISTENLVDGANIPMELLPEKPERPLCEYNPTEFLLNVNFQSFEFTGSSSVGANINVGFNSGASIPIELGFSSRTSRLFLDVSAIDPKTGFLVDSVNSEKKATNWKFSFGALFKIFGLSSDFSNSTPVAKIIREGLKTGITDLTKKMSQRLPPFRTVISKQPIEGLTEYILPIGYPSNLKEGDQLKVYNVDYKWYGAPCAEGSNYEVLNRREAGIVEVTNSRIDRSTVRLLAGTLKEPIKEGAIVEIHKLGGDRNSQKRKIMRLVHVNQVTASGKLVFEGKGEVDLPAIGQAQLSGMLSEAGFYSRK